MVIGIDLLWVRPEKNGGTESYIRSLLDGFKQYDSSNSYYLYVSLDNEKSFKQYFSYKQFVKRLCNLNSNIQIKRVIWENLHLDRMGIKDKLDIWFIPAYCKPFLTSNRIPYITVIHDIQAMHYPEYFGIFRNIFFRYSWANACRTSIKVVTISEFCKRDIKKHLKIAEQNIEVIYNPIIIKKSECDFDEIKSRYCIEKNKYLYTVSSLAKHKNLITILKTLKNLIDKGYLVKLVITGVNVNAINDINKFIQNHELRDNVVITGFITNEERDCLYEHCKVFLFPSVFEGFGMPPLEALQRGIPTITTKKTSIYEVTRGKAIYVEDPYNSEEWENKINEIDITKNKKIIFKEYSLEVITNKYMKLFKSIKLSI